MGKHLEFLADLSLVFIAIIWGSTFIIVKHSLQDTPVFSFLFMRFTLAGILLLPICLPRLKRVDRSVVLDGCILGIILFLAYALQTFALTIIPATVTAFITGLFVVFVPILSSIFLNKPPRLEAIAGVALATGGLALITMQGMILLSLGEFLALLCAFFVAIHIIITDVVSRRNDYIVLTLVQVHVVALCSLIFSFIYDPYVIPDCISSQLIFALGITSVFATILAFSIQMGMQKHTTPTKAALIFIIEPVSALFFSYWFGGELLTIKQYIGICIILLAMVFTETGTYINMKRRKAIVS